MPTLLMIADYIVTSTRTVNIVIYNVKYNDNKLNFYMKHLTF